jgi:hypothetical protein
MAKTKVVPLASQSALDALWCQLLLRQFPQLENSVMVDRASWAAKGVSGVERTFRLLNGEYVTIRSTGGGSVRVPTPGEKRATYEAVWKELGSRAIDHTSLPDPPNGIMFTSYEFDELCELIEEDDDEEDHSAP